MKKKRNQLFLVLLHVSWVALSRVNSNLATLHEFLFIIFRCHRYHSVVITVRLSAVSMYHCWVFEPFQGTRLAMIWLTKPNLFIITSISIYFCFLLVSVDLLDLYSFSSKFVNSNWLINPPHIRSRIKYELLSFFISFGICFVDRML